jgi:hypothetical protein
LVTRTSRPRGAARSGQATIDPVYISCPHCKFLFRIDDMPEVPFYSVEVGRCGALNFPIGDLKASDWSVVVTLRAY